MPRLAPLSLAATTGLEEILRASEGRMGFLPNSQLIMARRPEILRAFAQLGAAINGPSSTIDPQLRNMLSQMASRAAGCGYCMAPRTPPNASASPQRRRTRSGNLRRARSSLRRNAQRSGSRKAPRKSRTR